MRGDHRPQAHLQPQPADRLERRIDGVEERDEGDQRRDADHDARHHDGDIDERVEDAARSQPRMRSSPSAHSVPTIVAMTRGRAGDDQAGDQRLDRRSDC